MRFTSHQTMTMLHIFRYKSMIQTIIEVSKAVIAVDLAIILTAAAAMAISFTISIFSNPKSNIEP